MNAKDSDVDAMRKEFVSREEFEELQAQCLITMRELETAQQAILTTHKIVKELLEYEEIVKRINVEPPSADICPTCGLPSKHKLTEGDSDDA